MRHHNEELFQEFVLVSNCNSQLQKLSNDHPPFLHLNLPQIIPLLPRILPLAPNNPLPSLTPRHKPHPERLRQRINPILIPRITQIKPLFLPPFIHRRFNLKPPQYLGNSNEQATFRQMHTRTNPPTSPEP